jgi:hypothetical protein
VFGTYKMKIMNYVKVRTKHKTVLARANSTCARRNLPTSSVAFRRCVFGIQRIRHRTGVTKLKNLELYKLRFDGVLHRTPNTVFQIDAFHGPDAASIKTIYSLVGAFVAFEDNISRRIVNVIYAFPNAESALPNCIGKCLFL